MLRNVANKKGSINRACHHECARREKDGGRYWIRTSDLLGVNEVRYRCAKRPRKEEYVVVMVGEEGLEPPTTWV